MNSKLNKKQIYCIILVLFWAAVLCSCQTEQIPQIPRLASNAKVLAFGDSLTFGAGAGNEKNTYPAVLESLIKRDVVRSGVPGEVSAKGLQRLPMELDDHRPALLILCHGGNDILKKYPPDQTRENLRQMILLAKQRGISVLLIAVPQPGLVFSLSPAPLYQSLADELDVPFEKNTLSSLLSSTQYKSDAIHLNAKGYRKLAEAIAQLLRKSGALE